MFHKIKRPALAIMSLVVLTLVAPDISVAYLVSIQDPVLPKDEIRVRWVEKKFPNWPVSVLIPADSLIFTGQLPKDEKHDDFTFDSSIGVYGIAFYDALVQSAVKREIKAMIDNPYPNRGRPAEVKNISLNGYAGWEYRYVISQPGAKESYAIYVRQWLIGEKFYSLIATTGKPNMDEKNTVIKFLDSFKLIK
ncbi:MAG: hypothetical protein JNJ50_02710 [Acidobacteria bacterium]|nr:hypothetical protein [Acidobacteriota bacterium]